MGKKENRHILDYICRLPLEEITILEFHLKISRAMKGIKHPNLIYPIGKGVAVHIYPDKEDIRNYYIPIEPCLFQNMDITLEAVEKLLIDVIHDQDINTKDPEEKKKLLEKALEKACIIDENAKENTEKKVKISIRKKLSREKETVN